MTQCERKSQSPGNNIPSNTSQKPDIHCRPSLCQVILSGATAEGNTDGVRERTSCRHTQPHSPGLDPPCAQLWEAKNGPDVSRCPVTPEINILETESPTGGGKEAETGRALADLGRSTSGIVTSRCDSSSGQPGPLMHRPRVSSGKPTSPLLCSIPHQ